jgi:hypothetical protein
MMKQLKMLGLAVLAVTAAACGSSSDPGPTPTPPFPQPTGTVAVNIKVDDSANKVFTAGQLQWKGAMIYDTTTRKVTADATWGGPFAPLYDDGPWDAGGHEPAGAVAGDGIWGVTVFVTPPATGTATYSYGLNDDYYQTHFGNGWIWPPPNGSFDVAAGATAPVTASGLTLAKFGTTDMQVTIDTSALAPGTWDKTKVEVKGSAWAWGATQLTASGTKYTFTLSENVGAGKQFVHTGLLNSGAKPEFVFVFNGLEYKVGGAASPVGVTAAVKASGATTWTTVSIVNSTTGDKNTYITVP